MNLQVESVEDIIEERIGAALRAKALWLDWAEIFDAWRIFPRGVLAAVVKMTVSTCTTAVYWYIHLPDGHRSGADAAIVTGIVTVMTALLGATFGFYIQNGRRWTTP